MKNLRDKELSSLFGKLSNEEAPVDQNSWGHIKTNINKSRNSSLGAQQIKAIFFGLALIIAGVSLWTYQQDSENTPETKSHSSNQNEEAPIVEIEEKPSQETSSAVESTIKNSITTSPVKTTSAPILEEQSMFDGTEQVVGVSLTDSSRIDSTEKETESLVAEKHLDALTNNIPADSSKKTIQKDTAKVQNKPTPKASKIIIIEEDTLVQVDTVFKKKRFQKKR